MKISRFAQIVTIAAAGLLPMLYLPAAITRISETSFEVKPNDTLWIDAGGSNVTVVPIEGNSLRIVTQMFFPKAINDEQANKIAAMVKFDFGQSGDHVHATVSIPKTGGNTLRRAPVQIALLVSVPASQRLKIKTSRGNIDVGDVVARVNVRTQSGNVKLGRISGPVEVGSSGGNVALVSCSESAKIETRSGKIDASEILGDLDVATSYGAIRIINVAGSLNAKSSSGSIDAHFREKVPQETVIETARGDLNVFLGREIPCLLDALAYQGYVFGDRIDINTLAGGSGKTRLAGRINNGSTLLKLRSSGGNISVDTL